MKNNYFWIDCYRLYSACFDTIANQDIIKAESVHGQGHDLYLYPMGTKMARTGLSKVEALETTVTLAKISKENLKSKTTIIVDKRNKNEIPIMNL